MTIARSAGGVCVCLCLSVMSPAAASGQERQTAEPIAGPLTGLPVVDAPFSADAITSVTLRFADGGRLDQTTTSRYYRDREGRVRVEVVTPDPPRAATMAQRHIRTVIYQHPGSRGVETLDPVTRTVRGLPRNILGSAFGSGRHFTVPIGGARFLDVPHVQEWVRRYAGKSEDDALQVESLGTQQIAGVEVVGRRMTLTMPTGAFGSPRPIEIVDEQWESPELGIVIRARHSDSRTGVIEHWLTNIRRVEPAADLFIVPSDYTLDTTASPEDPWVGLVPPESYHAKQSPGRFVR